MQLRERLHRLSKLQWNSTVPSFNKHSGDPYGQGMLPSFQLGQYTFYSFGLAIGIGMVCSVLALQAYFRSHHIPVKTPLFACLVIPFGFVCARLDSMRFEPLPAVGRADFAYRFVHCGLTYFGGFVGATLAFML